MRYPNIRQIKIHREKVNAKVTGKNYLICYNDTVEQAMKQLSKSAFMLYIYLLMNKDGYKLEMSPQHFSDVSGCCLKTARSAFKELIEKRYITQTYEDSDKFYDFYETPQTKLNLKRETKEFLDLDMGEYIELTYEQLINEVGVEEAKTMWEVAQ